MRLSFKTFFLSNILFFFIAQILPGQNAPWKSIGPEGINYNAAIKYDQTSNRFYLFGGKTVFRSDDNCESWINISPVSKNPDNAVGLVDLIVNRTNPNEIFTISNNRKVYISTNSGEDWEIFYSDSIRNIDFIDDSNPNNMIAEVPSGGWGQYFQTIEKSTDGGESWFEITNGIEKENGPIRVWVNPYNPDIILALQEISYGGDVVIGYKLYKTINGGFNWTDIYLNKLSVLNSIIFDPNLDSTIYIKQYDKPWLKTTDGGTKWFSVGNGFPTDSSYTEKNMSLLSVSPYNSNILYTSESTMLPSENSSIYVSKNGGLSWENFGLITPSQYISSIIVNPDNYNEIVVCSYPYGVFKSFDNGKNWSNKSKGLTQVEICSFSAVDSKIIFAGLGNRGFYRTTDGGKNWTSIQKNVTTCPGKIVISKSGPNIIFSNDYIEGYRFSVSYDMGTTWQGFHADGLNVFDVASDNQTIFGDMFINGDNDLITSTILKSSNGGASWSVLDLKIENINYIDKIIIDPVNKDIVYALIWLRGTVSKNSIIRTINGGQDWKIIADTAGFIFINRYDSKYIYNSRGDGFYVSSDRGETFKRVLLSGDIIDITADMYNGGIIYALTIGGQILRSENKGYDWISIPSLRNSAGVRDIELVNSETGDPILLGSTWYNGILRYELKESDYVSSTPQSKIIKSYSLSQNYPNPFNPTTKIKYTIPSNVKGEKSNVKITVYDILGNEIVTLVNREQSPGEYEVDFDGSKLSSGIYFYVLRSGNNLLSGKMVLMK